MEIEKKVKTFKNQSAHYLENAFKFIEMGELEKASEFLWGAMAQALKAIAASKGLQLRSHSQIKNYSRELTRQLGSDTIGHAFDYAQGLHSNFYESDLTLEDVAVGVEYVRKAVEELFNLITEENKET